ncbi:MAG: NAD-dependent epimerase/dehydratase family protein [Pseudomonadales bacterium]|nr:NAD-dependent epimerase/dehydratase family protein [Pseudomonadales bacterium]MBO7005408.1 NAD-dependent epimerase/dehydratase family protein [Pseudomonadales bacterium]
MSLRVLIVGATGHIGRNLVETFHREGHHPTALARPASIHKLSGLNVEIEVSESPINYVGRNAHQFDWVIDAAAPYPLELFVGRGYYQDAQERQRQIIDACIKANAGLCYISSFVTCLGTDTGYQKFKRRSSPYYVLKERLEQQVLNATKGGLNAISVNPTTVVGPGDYRENSLIRLLINGALPVAMETTLNVIDARDLAHAVVGFLEQGQAPGPNLVGGHETSVSEIISLLNISDRNQPILIKHGRGLIAAGTSGLEALMQSFGTNTPVPALLSFLMTEPLPQVEVSYSTIPLKDSITDTLEWSQRNQL